jgi:16S rRNA (uracil1498-N3)-methyltransferase
VSLHWTFAEDISGDVVRIEESEAHHMLHVLRMKQGAEVTLFDGRGNIAHGVVEQVTKREVDCRVLMRRQAAETSLEGVTIAVSPPKGDRLRWMVEKLTELGVQRLILLQTKRTVVTPGETRLEKLTSAVIAACKQARRPRLMEISPITDLAEVLSTSRNMGDTICLAHPGHESHGEWWRTQAGKTSLLLVGPEGGFCEQEVALAMEAGALQVAWPGTILRTETAALVFGGLLVAGKFASESQETR